MRSLWMACGGCLCSGCTPAPAPSGRGRTEGRGEHMGRRREEREKTAGIKSSLKRDEIWANGRGREEAPCKDE